MDPARRAAQANARAAQDHAAAERLGSARSLTDLVREVEMEGRAVAAELARAGYPGIMPVRVTKRLRGPFRQGTTQGWPLGVQAVGGTETTDSYWLLSDGSVGAPDRYTDLRHQAHASVLSAILAGIRKLRGQIR